MPAKVIQANYPELDNIAALFSQQSDETTNLFQSIQRHLELLQRYGWVGKGAEAFYDEMQQEVLPAMRRLTNALNDASLSTQRVQKLLRDAEDEAARLFEGASITPAFGGKGIGAIIGDLVDSLLGGGGRAAVGDGKPRMMKISYGIDDFQQDAPPQQDGDPIPGTARERSETYNTWTENLRDQDGMVSDVRFFSAASSVTSLLGIIDDDGLLTGLGLLSGVDVPRTRIFLDIIGAVLMDGPMVEDPRVPDQRGNIDIYNGLVNGDLVADDGRLISPLTGQPVDSALEFDIHMVFWEQNRVQQVIEEVIYAGRNSPTTITGIMLSVDVLLGSGASPIGQSLIPNDTSFVVWANDIVSTLDGFEAGQNISFGPIEHRRALGIALIFQNHYPDDPALARHLYNEYMTENWQNMDDPVPPDMPAVETNPR